MATFTFETMTAEQASQFTSSDTLTFSSASLNPADVVVVNVGDVTTLTAGGKSLSFSAAAFTGGEIGFAGKTLTLQLGSPGDDRFIINNEGIVSIVYGFGGDDFIIGERVSVTPTFAGTLIEYRQPTGAYNIFGGGGADTIHGSRIGDHIYGFGLTGAVADDGGDFLSGDGGNDYVQGNGGNDTIEGGNGNDRLNGGSGNDESFGSDAGNDTLNGNRGNDTMSGGSDNDLVRGGADNDRVDGGGGDDIVMGDLGDDTVLGSQGIDTLTGGAGSDVFAPGPDQYAFEGPPGGRVDMITDYVDGVDKLAIGIFQQTTDDILHAPTDMNFASLSAALLYARQLLSDHAGERDVAVLQIGADAYLFYGWTGGGGGINTIFALNGVDADAIGFEDIVARIVPAGF